MSRKPILFSETRLRAAMEKEGVDLLIVRGNENSKYLSEFFNNGGHLTYRPFTVFYFRDPALAPAFIVPAVDLHLAMDSTWIEDVRAYAMAEFFTDIDTHFYDDFFQAARAVLDDRKVKNFVIGTEGDSLPSGYRTRLDELLEGNKVVDFSGPLEIVRMVKSPEEIRRLKKATDITIEAHAAFREAIKVGATDRDLFEVIVRKMIDEGSDGYRFINIGCGPKTSYAAHAPFPVGHTIARGDFVKVDMGATCLGYSADFVRSYFVGETSQRHQDIWKWLNEVQMELGMGMRPGMTGGEVFDKGYAMISKYLEKFPREFLGHGIGVGAHEQPRLNQVNRSVIEPDSIICIEYSYYHAGCRHHTEETFHVKENSVECWTERCPRELIVAA
ncbi:Xaa-Pro peptidase family protein [Ancylobacter sp. MQZ15Z-1]|uniref:Xaa-Pro peptidase family protein n=1 Tax=Ancylobacter mangrovi TaxID=2972472 RepID=A0A9X2PLF4_9HYPH|nr:Xaa-Pro peptidase family protein [Ancylobacter mangrovi]MCS0497222.1 Xaa-Pro peptidase family protein [Ancylobacter mangrovi]